MGGVSVRSSIYILGIDAAVIYPSREEPVGSQGLPCTNVTSAGSNYTAALELLLPPSTAPHSDTSTWPLSAPCQEHNPLSVCKWGTSQPPQMLEILSRSWFLQWRSHLSTLLAEASLIDENIQGRRACQEVLGLA